MIQVWLGTLEKGILRWVRFSRTLVSGGYPITLITRLWMRQGRIYALYKIRNCGVKNLVRNIESSGGRWHFNQGCCSKNTSISLQLKKKLFYFSLLFVKFIDKCIISRYFSNLTLDFYNTVWKYSWRIDILGMRNIHSIYGPHATDRKPNLHTAAFVKCSF